MDKLDYIPRLYKFIVEQIRMTTYLNKECKIGIIQAGIENYSLIGYTNEEWEQAWIWALADEYGGGCEVTQD